MPLNRPVRLVMNVRRRHSQLFVPDFRIKKDVLPDRYTEEWFQATEPGVYQVFCAEYCGKGHSDMLAKVYVWTTRAYQKWLVEGDEELKTMPLQELGEADP